jgi:2-keto-4-pentenoate hydratase/2-oxohepta-3-ene-1,7-dioic acid hydratase in catechol pathway
MTAVAFQLGTFSVAGCRPFPGLVVNDAVVALRAIRERLPGPAETLECLLEDWDRNFEALAHTVQTLADGQAPELAQMFVPVSQLSVHAPLSAPGTVYCSGANYKRHVVDLIVAHQDQSQLQGMTVEQKRAWGMELMDRRAQTGTPFIFVKPRSSLCGPFDSVTVPYDATKPDWELELAVIIGRRARRISRDRALDYVAGYTIANDITLREKVFRRKEDSPELGMDFALSKGAPSFLPLGPYLVPAAFVRDPQRLRLTLKLNGQIMQDEETSDMIFDVARLIEYISGSVELQPGDVICTGSPAGNGMHYGRFIQHGDVLEGTITGLGTQRTPCVLEPKNAPI